MYKIHLLPAAYGDSILIEYGETEPKYILIDGGPFYNDKELAPALKRVAPNLKVLELLVVTHIDIDHIDGIVTMLNDPEFSVTVKDIWFNGFKELEKVSGFLGALQGEYVSALIKEKQLPHNKWFEGEPVMVKDYAALPVIDLEEGMKLTLLNPGKNALIKLEKVWKDELLKYGTDADYLEKLGEDKRYQFRGWLGDIPIDQLQEAEVDGDTSKPNGSSIAFIATYKGKSCLLSGDANSDYLLKAIEPMLEASGETRLKLDAWKLSHHGSKKSNLEILMQKIECKKILVSSNGAKYEHPDDECIAKLLKHNGPGIEFYFNYNTKFNNRWADIALQEEYHFKSFYPVDSDEPGISLPLI
jgi:beta-lactamase superfamily II metal-dependent hydrolase